MRKRLAAFGLILFLSTQLALAKGKEVGTEREKNLLTAETFAGLELRNLGPALKSGRIADIAVDPTDRSVWYVAVASGGVWKTLNSGTTWTSIFDDQPSYSIGTVTVDPANSNVIWVGTGENNSQRSVGWGDGVYKSLDAGKSWRRMGLEKSEHIGKIVLDPRSSRTVWVAAQGPLWASGGDRGLYKSVDAGETWERVLHISDNTGITDIVLDPRDPDVAYAATYQRRRRVWAVVAGGPEGGIHKTEDGGSTWRELTSGLPSGDMGRIGLALAPEDPDIVYATIAATEEERGFYVSEDRGESWEKRSDYVSIDPQYYQEIFPDPHRPGRVYNMDVWIHVTEDWGRTWNPVNSEFKHVDNHALLFDPEDPDYLMIGCDGGLYETFDRSKTWRFIDNLPVTQFYRVGIDDDRPFYNVYGGTQDNDTQGGPSRTTHVHGIRNSDWFVTVGGDGYQTRVEPGNPDIVYSMWQYGGLVRYDRRSGERIDIQPQPEPGEQPLKWNWDSPLLISPHSKTRLYFASNRLYRSDDRGDNWLAVSPDLSRQIDRNRLPVMGQVWGVDAIWKNVFTSFYGAIVAFDESPLVEGLLYAGTDDGLVQVSEDGGEAWRRTERFPGIPERTYVSDLTASRHDPDTVFAAFNNHKSGDFRPYLLRSTDRGRTWSAMSGDLPDGHVLWSIVQDGEKRDLLFAGTEFGLFFTLDGGRHWIELSGGVPNVAFRDLEIQDREVDLVAATFGRGFMVFDDYTPLREVSADLLQERATLFPVKKTWMYLPSAPLGEGEKDVQGDAFFTAPNPPFGAIFTYYLRDELKTRKKKRQETEKQLREADQPVGYPPWDELRTEDREETPTALLTVKDQDGRVVVRLPAPTGAGFHRVAWNLRHAAPDPTDLEDERKDGPEGPPALPGTYTVELATRLDGVLTPLEQKQSFEIQPLGLETLGAEDRAELLAFQEKSARLLRAVLGASEIVAETTTRLDHLKQAVSDTPSADPALADRIRELESQLADLKVDLLGDRTVSRRREPVMPSIRQRIDRTVRAHWSSSSSPTGTHHRNYEIAAVAFAPWLEELRALVEVDLEAVETELEMAGGPWTPGRSVPIWQPE